MTERKQRLLVQSGIHFPEAPRWHQGHLWFTDVYDRRVLRVSPDGNVELMADLPDDSDGLGFLPDGTPIAVLMNRKQLVRIERGKTVIHAELSAIQGWILTDMVMDDGGHAYVGAVKNRRADSNGGYHAIAFVDPDGSYRTVDERAYPLIDSPNGMVITTNRKSLIFACPRAKRLVAMTIETDGSLSNARVFAEVPHEPDGICLDAAGAVWMGGLESGLFLRVADGGKILDSISIGHELAIACMLGGPDRRTFFMLTSQPDESEPPPAPLFLGQAPWAARLVVGRGKSFTGFIRTVRVEVPGVGFP